MASLNTRTCFKPNRTLRNLLVHVKDQVPSSMKKGIVYQIQCGSCEESYIEQSGRNLSNRQWQNMR